MYEYGGLRIAMIAVENIYPLSMQEFFCILKLKMNTHQYCHLHLKSVLGPHTASQFTNAIIW